MVGLDPTTWEPTRVKLGGRLLDGNGEEFLQNYGEAQGERYSTTRDALTYAIYKEVESGRGSPHGGVYLSFQHVADSTLRAALGPVIEIFKRNNIDLTRQPVEVFPIAHYQMGGVEVDTDMASMRAGALCGGRARGRCQWSKSAFRQCSCRKRWSSANGRAREPRRFAARRKTASLGR